MVLRMACEVRRPVRIFAVWTLLFSLMIALGWTPREPYAPTATVVHAIRHTAIGELVVNGLADVALTILQGRFWYTY